jgi:transcriptional regulator with XRE-family HTH domain
MVLLRRVIGDALRARRQGQHRTLREVSTAANMSLGYLSEIERGQKEASSELLAAICDALGAQLSEVLREVSDTLMLAEQMQGVLVPVQDDAPPAAEAKERRVRTEGDVSVSVRQETPLKATLRATRKPRPGDRGRDVIYAA